MSEHEPNGTAVEVVPTSALGAIIKAEIDMQITTAKQYPRSVAGFKRTALAMATLDEETAGACFYAVPRAGKTVEGPSIRLAEIVGSAWGNIRYGSRVIADNGRVITAQGVCHDLERNVAATVEVQRRATDKRGRRYNDDLVVLTGNAACAIALRNAIFKVIPQVYVKDIMAEAKRVSIGDAKTLANKRAEAVSYFQKMGVPPDRVYAAVGKAALEDVGPGELATLKGLATAIKDGETTVDEAFPAPAAPPTPGKSRTDQLAEKLGARGNGPDTVKRLLDLGDQIPAEWLAERLAGYGVARIEDLSGSAAAELLSAVLQLQVDAAGREIGDEPSEEGA